MAAQLIAGLDPSRFDRTLCLTRASFGTMLEDVQASGVRCLLLNRGSGREIRNWHPLVTTLLRDRIDILHAHQYGSNVVGSVLGRTLGVPVVISHEQTWAYDGDRLRVFLDRAVIARCSDVFVAVSQEDRRRMTSVERIDDCRTRWIPNAITPGARTGADVRAELGIPNGAPVVGTLSHLRPQKALEILVAAAAIVHRAIPELRVLIAGYGSEDQDRELRNQIAAVGLESVVLLLGPRADTGDFLAAVDVATSSSDYEGTPLAVMEYMAAGKPIVATRVGGTVDLIDSGVHGVLVERRDPEAMAAALLALLGDPTRKESLGRNARARFQAEFTMEIALKRFETLYEELYRATARARDEGWAPMGPASSAGGPQATAPAFTT